MGENRGGWEKRPAYGIDELLEPSHFPFVSGIRKPLEELSHLQATCGSQLLSIRRAFAEEAGQAV